MTEVFQKMLKYSEEDKYNCAACGYGSCEQMAIAIHNGLNKPENCHFYKEALLRKLSTTIKLDLHSNLDNLILGNDNQNSSVINMAASIKQYIGTVNAMREIVKSQNDNINGIAQAMSELTNGIENVHNHATDSAIHASTGLKSSTESANKVKVLAEQVGSFSTNMNNISNEVNNVLLMSEKIGKMLKGIVEIANQTNLLAINAAVEAARAGSHGHGFSIVAGEVRTLAGKTSALTREIGDVIDGIRKNVDSAVKETANGLKISENGKKLSTEALAAINDLVNGVQQINDMTNKITHITREQQDAAQEILTSTEYLNNASAEVDDTLSEQIDAMKEIIRSFNVVKGITGENRSIADNITDIAHKLEETVQSITTNVSAN